MKALRCLLVATGALVAGVGVACSDESASESHASGGLAGSANTGGALGGAPANAGHGGNQARGGGAGNQAAGSGGDNEHGGTNAGGTLGDAGSPGAAGEAAGGATSATFECTTSGDRFATNVVAHEFGAGQSFGQDRFPAAVLGPPRGGGCCAGSTDVTSLGDGGWVVLEFANNVIVDADGPDFIVFENAFVPSNAPPESVFAELGSVSVSQDGVHWFDFACTSTTYPFAGCAGWRAVLANADTNTIDATDPTSAGGDAFDLAELGINWARYVRIIDRPEADGGVGTFDLDAVAIANGGCP
ncbi:MAG: hypothetical protein ACOY0T_27895 [Myxococcota bacterium]